MATAKGWTKQLRAYAEPGEKPPCTEDGKGSKKDRTATGTRTGDHGNSQQGASTEDKDMSIDETEMQKRLDAQKTEADKATAKALADAKALAVDITKVAAEAGVPQMAARMIDKGLTLEQAKAKIADAAKIKAKVASAVKMCSAIDPKLADEYLANDASLEHVGNDLLDRMATAQAATSTRTQHSGASAALAAQAKEKGTAQADGDGLNASAIYEKRRKDVAERTNSGRYFQV